MSHIPDTRNPKKESPYTGTKGAKEQPEENGYYQGLLNDIDAEFVAGFDWVIEQVFKNFFYNLEVYEDDLDEQGFDLHRIESFEEHYSELADSLESGEDVEIKTSDTKIGIMLALIKAFYHYAEMERDELIVSMIDNMDDDEYAEMANALKAGRKNVLLKKEEETTP